MSRANIAVPAMLELSRSLCGGSALRTLFYPDDFRTNICREQRPAFSEHVIQPCTCGLRCENRGQDQGGVELWADDPGVEGYTRQYDSRPAAGIARDRQIEHLQSSKSGESPGQRHGSNFYQAAAHQKGGCHRKRETANQI